MCLETTKEETEKFRKKHKNEKYIWCYKVYHARFGGYYKAGLYNLIFNTIIKISPGEIRSNRSRLNFDKRDGDTWYDNYDSDILPMLKQQGF